MIPVVMRLENGMGYWPPSLRKLRLRVLRTSTAVLLIWLLTIWWGERRIFTASVEQCQWVAWETWRPQANPHHILLIADPQLVDPHTYPGRPWPLSTLTILYTDLYLRRTHALLQSRLQPDSTLFLGDLFDGGREWATAASSSPEAQYKKYGPNFWLKEYRRFSNIFLKKRYDGPSTSTADPMGKRVIASVPGNHDLGFASGIQPAVKSRFDAFFGPLNRVDVIGNHSIVSLDTVSLSAMDQVDPKTGSSGAGDGSASASANSHIWEPVEDFLSRAKATREKAVHREAIRMGLVPPKSLQAVHSPDVIGIAQYQLPQQHPAPSVPSSLFPTILLSHVPLFRQANTPCGPLREGNPSISLSSGYQYQNVLTPLISSDIVKHLSASEVVQIYSGDDHDYCEIEHSEFTGRIREITVKSMSWAMGVRHPGVQLVSLWNPIDPTKLDTIPDELATPRDTLQNHLCLLPDQLGIFIRYVQVLVLSLITLLIGAIRYNPYTTPHEPSNSEPLLPFSTTHKPTSTSSSSSSNDTHLNSRPKPSSRSHSRYGNIPPSSRSTSPIHGPFTPAPGSHLIDLARNTYTPPGSSNSTGSDDWARHRSPKHKRRKGWIGSGGPPRSKFRYFTQSLWEVTIPVLAFYFWVLWNG